MQVNICILCITSSLSFMRQWMEYWSIPAGSEQGKPQLLRARWVAHSTYMPSASEQKHTDTSPIFFVVAFPLPLLVEEKSPMKWSKNSLAPQFEMVGAESSWMLLPPEVQEQVCNLLSTKDLLAISRALSTWTDESMRQLECRGGCAVRWA